DNRAGQAEARDRRLPLNPASARNVPGLRQREAFGDTARTDAPELWPVHARFRGSRGVCADTEGHDKTDCKSLAPFHPSLLQTTIIRGWPSVLDDWKVSCPARAVPL